jgi:hypothetical protein
MSIPSGWDLPAGIASRLGQSVGRQRILVDDDHLLLVLHRLPRSGTAVREGVYFWRLPGGEWRASMGGVGLTALRGHVSTYAGAIAELEARHETATNASEYFAVLEGIAPLDRATSNLAATLQAAREAFPEAHELISLRDETSDIERAAELLQKGAKNALDFHIARQNEEQSRLAFEAARSGNRLNVIAAVFLPLTAITGVFGMNLPSGLENAPPALFWAIFALSTAFGLALGALLSRSK